MRIYINSKTGERQINLTKAEINYLTQSLFILDQLSRLGNFEGTQAEQGSDAIEFILTEFGPEKEGDQNEAPSVSN